MEVPNYNRIIGIIFGKYYRESILGPGWEEQMLKLRENWGTEITRYRARGFSNEQEAIYQNYKQFDKKFGKGIIRYDDWRCYIYGTCIEFCLVQIWIRF